MPWIRLFVAVLGWLPACQSVVRAGLWDVTTASGTTYPSTTLDSLSADSVWVSDAALRTSAVLIDEIVNLDALSQPIIGGLYGTLIGAGVLAAGRAEGVAKDTSMRVGGRGRRFEAAFPKRRTGSQMLRSCSCDAERVRFELTEPLRVQQFSRLSYSTTLAPLRASRCPGAGMTNIAGPTCRRQAPDR